MLRFYEMFKPVSKGLSQLAVFFNITATSGQAAIAIFLLAPVLMFNGTDQLSAFSSAQLHALAATFLRLDYYGYTAALVFFAGYDLLIGYLAFQSRFIPRPIGLLMMN